MNYRQIEAFRAIMLTGTTAKAAQYMHTSQPAVSRLLAQLEASLQMRLFERDRSRLRATAEAKLWFAELERTYAGLEHLRQYAAQLRQGSGGSITIGCLPALGFGPMPKIIAAFRRDFSNVLVRFEIGSSAQVRDWVSRGQCDLGFAADEVELEGMVSTLVAVRDAWVAMPSNHPLAKQHDVRTEQLCDYPFIGLSRRDATRRQLDELLAANGRSLQLACETPYSITVASLARNGVGIGLVNPLALDELDTQDLALRPLKDKITFRTLGLQVSNLPLSLPAQAFLAAAKSILETAPAAGTTDRKKREASAVSTPTGTTAREGTARNPASKS